MSSKTLVKFLLYVSKVYDSIYIIYLNKTRYNNIYTMKVIFAIIITTILSVATMKQTIKPKLCINCKHFILHTDNNKFGKCGLFPVNKSGNFYLVNGINEEDMDYRYCETARSFSDMCGENGDFHKRKYVKKQKDIYIPTMDEFLLMKILHKKSD